jgi:hypothetical protein
MVVKHTVVGVRISSVGAIPRNQSETLRKARIAWRCSSALPRKRQRANALERVFARIAFDIRRSTFRSGRRIFGRLPEST